MNIPLQLYLLIIATVSYLIWAIIHHRRDKSLTLNTFLEYLLTAILALTLLIGVLL